MLKYANAQVVFQEFPGETTLAINITGCIHQCPGCHSPHLWKDEGTPLTVETLSGLIEPYKDSITCVGFMGGDQDVNTLHMLVGVMHFTYPSLKFGWYSGNNFWSDEMMEPFDYVKFGSYKKDLGGLDSPTTNQMMFKHIRKNWLEWQEGDLDMWLNITKYFWKDTPADLKKLLIEVNYDKLAFINRVTSKLSLFEMVGLTVDGYETKMEKVTDDNFVKGYIMALNGHVPPDECIPQEYRRKWGSNDEWEKVKKPC